MNKKIYNNIPITVWHMGWPKKDTPFQSLINRSTKNLIIIFIQISNVLSKRYVIYNAL